MEWAQRKGMTGNIECPMCRKFFVHASKNTGEPLALCRVLYVITAK